MLSVIKNAKTHPATGVVSRAEGLFKITVPFLHQKKQTKPFDFVCFYMSLSVAGTYKSTLSASCQPQNL